MITRVTETKWLLIALMMTIALGILLPSATPVECAEKSNYDQAMKHYYAGNYTEAAKLLEVYVKDNDDPKAYFRLGYSLYKLGRHEEANKYFEKSYIVKPAYTPTPELEGENKRLKEVRPEGFYEGNLTPPDLSSEPTAQVPEGMIAVEKPSSLAVPVESEEADPATIDAIENTPEPVVEPAAEVAIANKPDEEVAVVNEPAPVEQNVEPPVAEQAPAPARTTTPATEPANELPIFALLAILVAFMIPVFAIAFIFYAAHAFFLYRVADKTNVGTPLLAIAPFANAITLSQAAGKSIVFGIVIIVFTVFAIAAPFGISFVGQDSMIAMILGIASGVLPLIAWVLRAVLWMFVADNLGKKKLFGLLTIIPVVHLGIMGWFAFSKSDEGGLATISNASDLSGEPELDLPDIPDDFDDMDEMPDLGEMDDMDFDDSDFK